MEGAFYVFDDINERADDLGIVGLNCIELNCGALRVLL